jgi:hypothetical protein
VLGEQAPRLEVEQVVARGLVHDVVAPPVDVDRVALIGMANGMREERGLAVVEALLGPQLDLDLAKLASQFAATSKILA